jgi:hypothetical protein
LNAIGPHDDPRSRRAIGVDENPSASNHLAEVVDGPSYGVIPIAGPEYAQVGDGPFGGKR